MESKQRWQDWVVVALGVWLFFSPFLMTYGSLTGAAAWDSYAVGAIAALFAASALWSPATRSGRSRSGPREQHTFVIADGSPLESRQSPRLPGY